jgi:hypothetical protein
MPRISPAQSFLFTMPPKNNKKGKKLPPAKASNAAGKAKDAAELPNLKLYARMKQFEEKKSEPMRLSKLMPHSTRARLLQEDGVNKLYGNIFTKGTLCIHTRSL